MHEGHRQRLKRRFLQEGLDSFEDHEVFELLLYYAIPQGDTNPLAHRILDEFDKLPKAVFDASLEDLLKIDGVGEHTAVLIKLIPQLSNFFTSLSTREMTVLNTSFDAGKYVCSKIGCLKNEVFAIICLDAQRRVLKFEKIENGTASQANVSPRKVVECAIKYNSSGVILCHNHPSGGNVASESDRILTNKLCSLLEGMEIHVIDHMIAISSEKYISMSDSGIMPN